MNLLISNKEKCSAHEIEALNEILKKIAAKTTDILGNDTIRTGGKNQPAGNFFGIYAYKGENGNIKITLDLSYHDSLAMTSKGKVLGWLDGIYSAAHRGTKKVVAEDLGDTLQFDSIADLAQAINSMITEQSQKIDVSNLSNTPQHGVA